MLPILAPPTGNAFVWLRHILSGARRPHGLGGTPTKFGKRVASVSATGQIAGELKTMHAAGQCTQGPWAQWIAQFGQQWPNHNIERDVEVAGKHFTPERVRFEWLTPIS